MILLQEIQDFIIGLLIIWWEIKKKTIPILKLMGHLVFTNNIFTVIQEKCKYMIINICEKIQLII